MDSKIVSIHQPNYLPWLGLFHKIKNSYVHIFMDNVQFSNKGNWTYRVRINTKNKPIFISVPTFKKSKSLIKEVQIKYNEELWRKKHMKTIEMNYSKSPFFKQVMPIIENTLNSGYNFISDLNIAFIKKICSKLSFQTNFIKGSELNVEGKKSELLAKMTKEVGGDIYLYGGSGAEYQDPYVFDYYGVKLLSQSFEHPVYEQGTKEFIPGLSIVDPLFYHGFDGVNEMLYPINTYE